jgi:hypothetical protein
LIKEDFKVGDSKFMENKINHSKTEGLETFGTKLTLFGKYPNFMIDYILPEMLAKFSRYSTLVSSLTQT